MVVWQPHNKNSSEKTNFCILYKLSISTQTFHRDFKLQKFQSSNFALCIYKHTCCVQGKMNGLTLLMVAALEGDEIIVDVLIACVSQ